MKLKSILTSGVAACALVGGTAAQAGGTYVSVFGGGQDIGVSAHEGLIGLSIPLGN